MLDLRRVPRIFGAATKMLAGLIKDLAAQGVRSELSGVERDSDNYRQLQAWEAEQRIVRLFPSVLCQRVPLDQFNAFRARRPVAGERIMRSLAQMLALR